ncbi:NERD domain-containing protein, partial [Francisella tularensis subsp. holarctica]|nr:NERD domain-containing protein [Francisella tularensis subsp. holarctica]
EDAPLSENFLADDSYKDVLSLEILIPFIKSKEKYLEKIPTCSRRKIIRKLEKK